MPILHIQGIDAEYRGLFPDEEILYSELPQDEQYFHKIEHPFSDDELVAIAHKEHEYSYRQKQWLDKENFRMDNGVYAMINGELTFIPGSVWGYVNYWTLENGNNPDYRNCTRKIFILKEYLINHPKVLALTRGKSRRKGATSEGTFFEWWICGRKKEKIGGMVSYGDDSVKKIFQMLFMRGFKSMLPCFVEDFDSSAENFVRFRKPVEKKKKGVPIKREGLNSYIDYQPTTLNAYDSGRVSYLLGDEFGKWERVDVNTYWSKVKPTLTIGSKKVGFAYIPTTVNPRKKGGANYRIFWDSANQNTINPKTGQPYGVDIPSRVVRIFDPATEGYEGCIDKFGESIIDDPPIPVMGNDGNWVTEGSKSKIKREREGLEGERLMEHRRDFPLDEYDMFAFETGQCEFNETRIIKQLEELEMNPVFLRKIRLYEEEKTIKSILPNKKDKIVKEIKYMDDEKGGWLLLEEPKEKNKFSDIGDIYAPENILNYCIGVDTFRIGFAEAGSKGTICVFKKSCVINGEETGNYPVALYIGRPRLVQHLYDEVLKACMWYGCKVNFEISAGDFFYGYFHEKRAIDFLYWTPAVDPNKRNPIYKPGTESASPFELSAQLECAKLYIDGNLVDGYNGSVHRIKFPDILKQALDYNHSERTPYDVMISLMMALLPALKVSTVRKNPELKPKMIMQQYKIKLPAA